MSILALLALKRSPVPRKIVGGLFVIGGCLLIIVSRKRVQAKDIPKL